MFCSTFVSKLISESKRVLISGTGGGYDVFTGLPLYFELEKFIGHNSNLYFPLAFYSF